MRTFRGVTLGIIIPLVVLPVVLVVAYVWYRSRIAALRADTETRPISGARLTSEALRRLPQPPWRIVIEIAPSLLEGVDHVAIGSCGVVPLITVVADRPTVDVARDPMSVVSTSIARSVVDAAIADVGVPSMAPVKVYWGAPRPALPAGRPTESGTIDVEGQRLESWLGSLPEGVLSPTQVDACWRAIVLAIGRPDPMP